MASMSSTHCFFDRSNCEKRRTFSIESAAWLPSAQSSFSSRRKNPPLSPPCRASPLAPPRSHRSDKTQYAGLYASVATLQVPAFFVAGPAPATRVLFRLLDTPAAACKSPRGFPQSRPPRPTPHQASPQCARQNLAEIPAAPANSRLPPPVPSILWNSRASAVRGFSGQKLPQGGAQRHSFVHA